MVWSRFDNRGRQRCRSPEVILTIECIGEVPLVRFGKFRSSVSGQCLTQIIPDFNDELCLRRDVRAGLAELSLQIEKRIDALGSVMPKHYQTLALSVSLRSTPGAGEGVDRAPQSVANFSEMRSFLFTIARTPHEFRPRNSIGWFGNENYLRGGYVCCDSAEIPGFCNRLEEWTNRQPEIGIGERLLLWYLTVIIHPFADGNGRFARALSMLLRSNAPARVLLGTLWIAYVRDTSIVRKVLQSCVAKASVDDVWKYLLNHWTDELLPQFEISCERFSQLTQQLPNAASNLAAGGIINGEIIRRSLGRSLRVSERLIQRLVDADVLAPLQNSEYFCLPEYLAHIRAEIRDASPVGTPTSPLDSAIAARHW